MKYLILDTNIYLDMVVSRNRSHKSDSYNQMQTLLDYGEIQLIVPAVVINEIKRNLDDEVKSIYIKLGKVKKDIKELYWINKIEELDAFNISIKNISKNIEQLLSDFDTEKYISNAHSLFDKLFEHENVIILKESPNVLLNATKRKLYKNRPYHDNKKDKDSFADAVIIETLINIKDYQEVIDFTFEDQLYFVSRNTKDFSHQETKTLLHKDLVESLELNNLKDRFNYRIHFTKTLLEDFKEEIENAGLSEELNELRKEFYREEISMNRDAGGLKPLTADWYEIISNESDIEKMMSSFIDFTEDLNGDFENYTESFHEIEEVLNQIESEEIKDEYMDLFKEAISLNPEEYISEEMWRCKDYFDYDDSILELTDFDNKKISVYVEGELNPQNGESDSLQIKIKSDKNELSTTFGEIEVTYGYLNFDEDGHASDGLQDNINFHLDSIHEAVEKEYDLISNQIREAHDILDEFILDYKLRL